MVAQLFRSRGKAASAALAASLIWAAAQPCAAQERRPRDHISQCFSCHGEDGVAKEFDVPHLAGQQEAYLYNQIKAFRTGKRPHKEMKVMSREMTDREMHEIAAFFASLPR